MLLLWSMRRLSLDSRIFRDELPQLLFNFSSFQIYELLLAGTAIGLARRRAWYDSGLLVGLENMFVCVPFLLVSQALLLENWIAAAFCLAGGGLAVARIAALKRRLKELAMPGPLLWMGAVLLCFNLAWPLLIRRLHQNVSMPGWDDRGLMLTSLEWNWLLPAAAALGLFLTTRPGAAAMPAGEERPFYNWRSFPLLALLMWAAGTGVHLYCISYVYGLPWNIAFLAPGAWVASWVLWRQAGRLVPEVVRATVQRGLLFPPALVLLCCLGATQPSVCLTLAVLNAVAFGAAAVVRRERLAVHLGAFSVLAALGAIRPAETAQIFGGGSLFYIVACALVSARPRLGIAGGFALGIGLACALGGTAMMLNFALQAALVFILLHSLRWGGGRHSDAAKARAICAACWLIHTAAWVIAMPAGAIAVTMACGSSILIVYTCARFVLGTWGPRIIAWSGAAVMWWGPLYLAGRHLLRAPEGVLELLASFALFGLGTRAALCKARRRAA
jgi:hypothetical protein